MQIVINIPSNDQLMERALKELYGVYTYYCTEYLKSGNERYKQKAQEQLNSIIKLRSNISERAK